MHALGVIFQRPLPGSVLKKPKEAAIGPTPFPNCSKCGTKTALAVRAPLRSSVGLNHFRTEEAAGSETHFYVTIHMMFAHIVKSGEKVDLKDIPTKKDGGMSEEEAEQLTEQLGEELTELQELLFAAGKTPLLLVLQGRDTSGKDGTIRHLLKYMNAQSTRVAPFKVPTPIEMAHDYLWRVHQQTPGKGETVIFNRSHYEDVLVVRVHEFVPPEVWQKRYEHINDWEKLLTDTGTLVLKFMLHISKDEQEERLLDREKEVEKAWKLSAGDWKEREFWDKYTEAYEDVASKCSPESAPWHIISADHKWYRNLAITEAIVEGLRPLKKGWNAKLEEIGAKAKEELAAYRTTP